MEPAKGGAGHFDRMPPVKDWSYLRAFILIDKSWRTLQIFVKYPFLCPFPKTLLYFNKLSGNLQHINRFVFFFSPILGFPSD